MSTVGVMLDRWLDRWINSSTMRQEPTTFCDMVPVDTTRVMANWSERSARIEKEVGAPIQSDLKLGKYVEGTQWSVKIPRPKGTIGMFHTHPYGWPIPSGSDVYEMLQKNDAAGCFGATGYRRTKINCYIRKHDEWNKTRDEMEQLIGDIKSFKGDVKERLRREEAGEIPPSEWEGYTHPEQERLRELYYRRRVLWERLGENPPLDRCTLYDVGPEKKIIFWEELEELSPTKR